MIFENHPSPEGIEKFNTSKLHELFLTKLMEVYQGEMRLLEVLPSLQEACCADHLKNLVAEYKRKKGEQVESLQQVFILLDLPISGKNSTIREVMIEECNKLTKIRKNRINDYAIGNMIMHISHLNQASYQWLSSLSLKLEMQHIMVLLEENFNMEKTIDVKMIMAI